MHRGYAWDMSGVLTVDEHVAARLRDEPILWLGSTRPDGRPHQVPVWFLWDGEASIVVFTQPHSQKVRNITANGAVWVNLDTAAGGKDVVMAEGRAALVDDVDATDPPFVAKYGSRMQQEPASWAATFPQAIRIDLARVIAWGGP